MKLRVISCLFFALLLGSNFSNAKNYCEPMPKPKTDEEAWYMPESALTKKAANEALKELGNQVNNGVKGRDFLIENELKIIKGHLYLAYLTEYKKEFGKEDEELRDEFCRFLRTEAYVSH